MNTRSLPIAPELNHNEGLADNNSTHVIHDTINK